MLEITMAVYVGTALATSLVLFLDESFWEEVKGENSLEIFLVAIAVSFLWPYAAYKMVTK